MTCNQADHLLALARLAERGGSFTPRNVQRELGTAHRTHGTTRTLRALVAQGLVRVVSEAGAHTAYTPTQAGGSEARAIRRARAGDRTRP